MSAVNGPRLDASLGPVDLMVRGGTVVDGTGNPRYRADVGVTSGTIVGMGDLSTIRAARVLDASHLLVAPGLIDIHSHSDFTLLVDARAQSSIGQGVTTEVIGNCGHGCAPITDAAWFRSNIYGYTSGVEMNWHTVGEYLQRLEDARPAVNVAMLVPNGNLRLSVIGMAERPAALHEVRQMVRLLEAGLRAGAFGFSTGLEYPAERACSEAEVSALCRVVAETGGLYATHTRNRDVGALEAIEEAVRTAEATDVRLQISHIIPRRAGVPDAPARALALVDEARARGVDVEFDAHTRLHGITNLSTCLPPWALAEDHPGLAASLRDPRARAKMKEYPSIISSFARGGWDRIFLFKSDRCADRVGKSIPELAGPGQDPWDAIYDILLAEIADVHAPLCVCQAYDEDDLAVTYRHPVCTIGSDATALGVDGPLAASTFLGAFTWAAWFFRRFVREKAVFTIEEAVHKLSALPAKRLGLSKRGYIGEGARADLVVFDPGRFEDRGTLQSPNQLARGIVHVVVNGCVAFENGRFTDVRGGEVLRPT
jgi:N-acyl-D-aspartate/D-glutamate deacylase